MIEACTDRESSRCSYIMYTEVLTLCRISKGAEVKEEHKTVSTNPHPLPNLNQEENSI